MSSFILSFLAILALCCHLSFSASIPKGKLASGCTSANLTLDTSTVRQDGSCFSGTTHYVRVAVAYDNTFCDVYGGSMEEADAAVRNKIQRANEVFQASTCVQLVLAYLEPHCNDPADPYASVASVAAFGTPEASAEILNDFQNIWDTSRTSVSRDVAILLSGFEDGTSTAGFAYLSSVCTSFGYGWVERDSDSLFIHEVGHTLSAEHTTEGVMQATVFDDQVFFSEFSVGQITAFVDKSATCLPTSPPASV